MQQKGKCLALGAGAIGKSVSGYIFTQLGFDFRYAEIDDAVISDINRRGGYDLYTAVSGDQIKKQEIRGICAARVEDAQTAEFAAEADFIVTAVGAANLAAAAASIAGWVRRRSGQKRLAILLFENGSGLRELVEGELRRQLGSLPAWLSVSHASIERISKKVVREDGRIDGVSEEFIPPILTRRELADTQLVLHTEYFELADDVNRYYYRKLYLNNIGHAVLAYLGSKKGYATTLAAVADDEIQDVLFAVWDAAGEMVRLKYGFDEQEIDEYFAGRLQCYKNAALADPLARLARSPMRKLGRHERIIGAAELCHGYGISLEAFAPVLYCAVNYFSFQDEESIRLAILKERKGVEAVLREVCGLDPESELFRQLLQGYIEQSYRHI